MQSRLRTYESQTILSAGQFAGGVLSRAWCSPKKIGDTDSKAKRPRFFYTFRPSRLCLVRSGVTLNQASNKVLLRRINAGLVPLGLVFRTSINPTHSFPI